LAERNPADVFFPPPAFSVQTLISSCAHQEYVETIINLLFTMPRTPPRPAALDWRAGFRS
jgi:hypothetical protein